METDNLIIKMEPPEPEYEMYSPQHSRNDIISNQSENKHDLIEAEVGLVSELESIKSFLTWMKIWQNICVPRFILFEKET